MRLTSDQLVELNKIIKKSKLDLPVNKREVTEHNSTYGWLQKNVMIKNASKVTPRLAELLDLKIPETVK